MIQCQQEHQQKSQWSSVLSSHNASRWAPSIDRHWRDSLCLAASPCFGLTEFNLTLEQKHKLNISRSVYRCFHVLHPTSSNYWTELILNYWTIFIWNRLVSSCHKLSQVVADIHGLKGHLTYLRRHALFSGSGIAADMLQRLPPCPTAVTELSQMTQPMDVQGRLPVLSFSYPFVTDILSHLDKVGIIWSCNVICVARRFVNVMELDMCNGNSFEYRLGTSPPQKERSHWMSKLIDVKCKSAKQPNITQLPFWTFHSNTGLNAVQDVVDGFDKILFDNLGVASVATSKQVRSESWLPPTSMGAQQLGETRPRNKRGRPEPCPPHRISSGTSSHPWGKMTGRAQEPLRHAKQLRNIVATLCSSVTSRNSVIP